MNPDLVKGPWTKEEDQKVTVGTVPGTQWASPHPSGSRDGEAVLGVGRAVQLVLRAAVR